jgi:anaerobic magnesium-protoporphyrin IX monomethyl ester cyclase
LKIALIAVNCRYTHSCQALFYVRNELRRNLPEAECVIRQFALNDPYYPTLLRIAEGKPEALFFSVYLWNDDYVRRLVRDLGKLLPGVVVVLGGPQVGQDDGRGEEFPENCTLVRGEVEGLPAAFYRDLQEGSLRREYRAGALTPFRSPYRDEDFAGQLRNRQVYYESTRGCPYACSYCLSSATRGVRCQDPALVKEELAAILRHRPKTVRFVDRTFNAHPGRTLDLWQFLAACGGETAFHFEIAPELFTDEMFAFLATLAPDRFQFEIGLQSTNAATLAAVNRSMDLERVRANLTRLIALDNIHLHVDLILGLPHETRESFRHSCNEVFALFPHYIQVGLLKVLPGTPLAGAAGEFGLVARERPPYEILATGSLAPEELAALYWIGECIEAFYNSRFFRSVLAYIRRSEPDPFLFFEELTGVCRRHGFFELARTQELMSRMLLDLAAGREDRQLLVELLSYDWLRSGQRSLPGFLPGPSLAAARDRLWHSLPQNWPPHFSHATRDDFFKQATFAIFSGAALAAAGFTADLPESCVCFLPATTGVFKLRQTLVIPLEAW